MGFIMLLTILKILETNKFYIKYSLKFDKLEEMNGECDNNNSLQIGMNLIDLKGNGR
jgi:hypothetical protein